MVHSDLRDSGCSRWRSHRILYLSIIHFSIQFSTVFFLCFKYLVEYGHSVTVTLALADPIEEFFWVWVWWAECEYKELTVSVKNWVWAWITECEYDGPNVSVTDRVQCECERLERVWLCRTWGFLMRNFIDVVSIDLDRMCYGRHQFLDSFHARVRRTYCDHWLGVGVLGDEDINMGCNFGDTNVEVCPSVPSSNTF